MTNKGKFLTKKDLWEVLGDFFEKVIAPYFERIEKRLDGHDKRFDRVEIRLDKVETKLDKVDRRLNDTEGQLISMDRKLDLVAEQTTLGKKALAEHDKRISKVEKFALAT